MRTRRLPSSSDPVSSTLPKEAEGHRTVLLNETIESLAIEESDVVLDATLGGAGHAYEIAKRLGNGGTLIGIDADESAIVRSLEKLKGFTKPKIHLVAGNFRNLSDELTKLGISRIDKAIFDLGWSGYQLHAGRGFSFQKDEPLLMTYGEKTDPDTLTAEKIINEWEEESIADVIFGWGEERYSRRIAKRIVEEREKKPIRTSKELGEIIKLAVPPVYRFGRIHPATRTFQALRIAVNDELGALKSGLTSAWQHLAQGGRIAVISFHSIEDREVKRMMVEWEEAGEGKRIKRSPIVSSKEEISQNPRSRSAKLRVIQKI